MVLTKKHVIISDACFSSESKICDGKLYIDKEDVERQLLCNEFAGVGCRLQSRAKVSGLQMLVTSYSL